MSAETSRHDAWQGGDSDEAYMGRWSRQIAPAFSPLAGRARGQGLAGTGLRHRIIGSLASGAGRFEAP